MPPSTLPRGAIVAACADMIRACGLTLAELAWHMGEQLQAPLAEPAKRVVGDQAERVIAFADQPKGATVADVVDLLGVHYATAAYHCDKLASRHKLTKAKGRGEHAFRYFANPHHAEAYVEARQREDALREADEQRAAQEREQQAIQLAAERQQKAKQKADAKAERARLRSAGLVANAKQNPTFSAPKDDPTKPRGEAVKTEKTVETRDTTVRPTARWQTQQLPPDPRYPSFSSTPFGVNPDTGKAWGARA